VKSGTGSRDSLINLLIRKYGIIRVDE